VQSFKVEIPVPVIALVADVLDGRLERAATRVTVKSISSIDQHLKYDDPYLRPRSLR
jgi:hypothetical protein